MAGPPGVGKTTTAHLVCQELGYEVIEMNASTTRSKNTLRNEVGTLLGNTTLTQFFKKDGEAKHTHKKQAIIMDEVDGMAGNADRGGMSELIDLIKKTKIPIICMANDKDSPKMRSLKNHVFINNFSKMQVKQLAGAMKSICFREGITIDMPTLNSIIEGTNCDVRQILNNLEMWTQTNKTLTYDGVKKNVKETEKYTKKNPFQFASTFFSQSFHTKPLGDRIDLFFHDYSMTPLFVQDMYPKINTGGDMRKKLEQLAEAADSIADSDVMYETIYRAQNFGLLPNFAIASCIRPGFAMQGFLQERTMFPAWFGKNSAQGKFKRYLGELGHHMRTETSVDKEDLRMTFLPFLRHKLISPLTKAAEGGNGSGDVIDLMDTYHLTRDDWDSINEICQLKGQKELTKDIDTKTKSAFTREYKKSAHVMPYVEEATARAGKKKKSASTSSLPGMDDDVTGLEADDDDDDEDDVSHMKKAGKGAKGKGKKAAGGKKKAPAKKKKK